MPKKTKKEKIIAEYRRKMASTYSSDKPVQEYQPKETLSRQSNQTFSYTPSSAKNTESKTATMAIDPKEFTAIKKDLVWTLILTILILIGEIGLWRVLG